MSRKIIKQAVRIGKRLSNSSEGWIKTSCQKPLTEEEFAKRKKKRKIAKKNRKNRK